jgi:hypothetical protein
VPTSDPQPRLAVPLEQRLERARHRIGRPGHALQATSVAEAGNQACAGKGVESVHRHMRCDDGVAILTRRAPATAERGPRGLPSPQRPNFPSPPNKSMTDETVGGRVPQVGGGIVGRAGGAGSGGKMRPGNESGLCASGFEWDWSRSSSLTAPS